MMSLPVVRTVLFSIHKTPQLLHIQLSEKGNRFAGHFHRLLKIFNVLLACVNPKKADTIMVIIVDTI